MPVREAIGEEQHDRARRRDVERLADAAGVAADQVALQRGELVARDRDTAEMTEAGRDAVDLTSLLLDALDDGARNVNALDRHWGQMDLRSLTRDCDDLRQ